MTSLSLLLLHPAAHVPKKNAVLRTSRGVRNAPHVVDAQRSLHALMRLQHPGDPLTGALAVVFTFAGPWPRGLVAPPDTSNLMELVADAGQGVLWINDAQLVDVRGVKVVDSSVWLQVEIHCATL
jgi:Holliday junction resolvase RusA-like endonuclease